MQPELRLGRVPQAALRTSALEAFVAAVARNSDAVAQDPNVLDIAAAVFEAFASRRSSGGLSRQDLLDACAGVCDERSFDSRFELFKKLKLLIPGVAKAHEDRYLFNPYGAAGILVFDRVSSTGGVDELLALLDRTRLAISRGTATAEQVSAALTWARGMLVVAADYLLMLVRTRSLEMMIAERHQHQHPSLMTDVKAVTELVRLKYTEMDPLAYTVILEAQRYLDARTQFVDRILEEGARAEDFGVLHHEQYLAVARDGSAELLSKALERFVFDPVDLPLSTATIALEVDQLRPPAPKAPQPPRPDNARTRDDPFRALVEREDRRVSIASDEAEVLLGAESMVDISDEMSARGWPGAARLLVSMVRATGPGRPFALEFGDSLRVDPTGQVTYLSPVRLKRTPHAAVETVDE
ncbi:hypothetical protein KIF24_16710 [Micromonospora sp. Llam7]|uniref:hypothetical protein n=1 Tax=Micromonospora tarapacensis TaxID=2835305 RepID=UPI001C834F20|nr:hypothetical protein [Micromonospora tarapacensis]MBX7267507.1 hypothetical protein [Micromonospora tarapacensis]